MLPLDKVIAAVEAEGERLRAEFYAPQGPRGRRGSCPADAEIEERLRAALLGLIDCGFVGEETAADPAAAAASEVWIVDPHDGTFEFMSGKRGSAISVALVRNGVPVLGVVHAPDSPDRGPDTVAWAEGCGPLRRNGRALQNDLSRARLGADALAWATASSALKPLAWSAGFQPSRYVAMPSIAYRLARVAAGDGVATLSNHGVAEYDIAAGLALLRAAGGVALDGEGREIVLTGKPGARISGCYAGAPHAAAALARFGWKAVDDEPRREPRVTLGFPRLDFGRSEAGGRLARAQGCFLGQVIGDNLGGMEEFKLLPGQPTDDSEMALTLARSLVRDGGHDADKVLDAYRAWLTSRPVDIGVTTEEGLLGRHKLDSQSNGSLMRVSPIGVFAAGDPALAARLARDDSCLTHRNEACVEACAGFAAAIAVAIGGGDRDAMLAAALAHARSPAREAIERGARGALPDFTTHPGWVLVALQNAFQKLFAKCTVEAALRTTVACRGDMDTNAAVAGALLGALHGREAFPSQWTLQVLACRPLAECGALRPRPMDYWPDDVLELAEAVLLAKKGSEQFIKNS